MENKAHALAAGLFTLILGAAVLIAAMWFSGDTYERAFYVLESKYAVTGLNEQATVRWRGVDIGRVTGIRFAPESAGTVLVDIAIQSDMTLTRSTFAELRYQGVTGLAYIMLDDAGKNPRPLPPAGYEDSARIPIRESLFSSLADAGQQVLADARDVMKRVNTLLSDENQTQIVLVASVRAPAWLDSDGIVYRLLYEGASKPQSYAMSRWAAEPPSLLADRLRSRLAAASKGVVTPAFGARSDYTLRVELEDFSQQFRAPGQSRVLLRARVTLLGSDSRVPLAQREFEVERAAEPNAAGAVKALTEATGAFLDELVPWIAASVAKRSS